MQDNQYLQVNWVDGMKINKSHFIAQDNAQIYQLAQHSSCLLNELNYGLLPVQQGGMGLKIFLSIDNQQKVQVRVQQCRAITAGGYFIEFNEDTALHGNNLKTQLLSIPVALRDLKSRSSAFYIVLTINPYQRVPYGAAEAAELPPRIPYSLPLFSVDLLPAEQVTKNAIGAMQLPLGKITVEDQKVMLEEDYIPPCVSVSSHPDLLEIQAGLEQFYSKMELYALQIIQKILQKKQANDMAVIVQKVCEIISFFTASQLAELKTVGIVQPPVYMVSKVSSLARLIKNTLDFYLGSGKEELMNYIAESCSISQGELEGAILQLSGHQYDHMDINRSIENVSKFTKVLSHLFYQLSRLEYIGKRKDAGIFVKEEVVNRVQDAPVQKRRSFLAD
jgi:hypothetical protein